MTNKYGNFVLLKAFNLAGDREKRNLQNALQKCFAKIHSSKYKSRWSQFFEECLKKSSEFSTKPLNKPLRGSRDFLYGEDSKKRGSGGSDEAGDDDFNDDSPQRFPGRKKNKLPTHYIPKTTQDTMPVERSKNRKSSAPISILKFSTNFS